MVELSPWKECAHEGETGAMSMEGVRSRARRFCAATWGEAEWGRMLLYLARKGHCFVEFYPPLEHVLHLAFPGALPWTAWTRLD